MATAAWGQRVLDEQLALAGAADPASKVNRAQVLDALHELDNGSERRALALATGWFRAASSPTDRGSAAALAAVALVLDPTVDGYKERLTDAAGLAAYAGTLDASDPMGQAARAMVGAAAGSVEQARQLVELVESVPKLDAEPRVFLALARKLMGERGNDVIDHLKQTLTARPGSARARAALVEVWLELGVTDEALKWANATAAGASPWLEALRGRALALAGQHDEAGAVLRAVEGSLPEGRRGDALYWLGLSLAARDAPAPDVDALAALLEARPGFAKEAVMLRALSAHRTGDHARTRTLLDPLMRGPPGLPTDTDAAWLMAETCAALGDLKCVDGAGARARGTDGDEARFHLIRALVVGAGRAEVDAQAELREAHRASPYDVALAKKVGEPVLTGGVAAAARLRSARRAFVRKGGAVVDALVAPLAQDPSCRVCRALRAAAASGQAAAERALVALEGRGPPLSEGDLVLVVDALGADPTPAARAALQRLAADARPAVQRAVTRARADHADPDARRRREAASGRHPAAHLENDPHDHGDAHPGARPAPKLPPMPGLGPRVEKP